MAMIILIVCILGITSVYSETCPSAKVIAPCQCIKDVKTGNISVACTEFGEKKTEELVNIIKTLHGKKSVELIFGDADFTKVPMNIFQGIGVIKLYFYFCKLADVSGDLVPLIGLEDTLEELTFLHSISKGNDLSGLKLGHFQKLKKLDISLNSIPELPNGLIENSPVENLSFYGNMITNLGDRAFASLSNLKKLQLYGNNFGLLKRKMLPTDADRLTTLDISGNFFASLDENVFSNFPALREVNLMANQISTLNQNTWESVWEQLDSVDLQDNPIQCDSDLEWTFGLRRPIHLDGTCEGPESVKGKYIADFIDNRGQ